MATPGSDAYPRSVAELVASRLREEIHTGELAPGTKLRLVPLAARLGVSTTPVRDALAVLDREGLATSEPQKGYVVIHPTTEDLEETYEMRIVLEALATRKAASNITDEELARLGAVLELMSSLTVDEIDPYVALNHEFHSTIYAAAGRPRLATAIEELRRATFVYVRIVASKQRYATDTQGEHEAIYEALQARDPELAAQAMTRHLTHTVEVVANSLRSHKTD